MKDRPSANKISVWWNSLKMHTKLFVVYVVIAIIPLVAISIVLVVKADSILNTVVERNYISTNKQMSNNVQNELDSYMDIIDSLCFNPQLNSLLNRQNQLTIDHKMVHDEINIILNSQLGQRDEIHKLTIYVDNKYLYAGGYIRRIDEEPEKKYLFDEIVSYGNEGVWMRPIKLGSDIQYLNVIYKPDEGAAGYYAYGYAKKMNYINRENTLILVVSFKEKELYSFMNKQSDNWNTFIVDGNGYIVSGTQREIIAKNIFESNESLYGNVFYELENSGLYDWENEHKQQFKVFYEKLSNGWIVVSAVPSDDIMNEKKAMIRFVVIVICLTVFLAAVLLSFISSQITNRIDVLLYKMKHITPGSQKEDLPVLDGTDEIAQMDKGFSQMNSRINQLIIQMYELEAKKRQSELEALQANINPHFLYNCLSTVSWMTYKSKPEQIREVLENIAKFYRLSINQGNEIVTIEQEIEHIKAYAEIEKYRTGGRVSIYYFIDDEAKTQVLPKLILQPVVENSIKHGMGDEERNISVKIRVERKADGIFITVTDDGVGLNYKAKNGDNFASLANNKNYGVKNIDQRIKLFFGEKYGLHIKPGEKRGVITTVHIPYNNGL